MLDKYQKAVSGIITHSTSDVSTFRAPSDGTISGLAIWAIVNFQTAIFNLSINGVAQFSGGGRPSISASGDPFVFLDSLAFGVLKGDYISLTVNTSPQGGISNIAWQVDFENGITAIPAGGDIGQVLAKQSGADGDVDWVDESGGGGGGLDYTPLYTQDFSTNTLDSNFQIGGTGASISGGQGLLLASANDSSGAFPKFELITPISLVDSCVICEIAEKPEAGTAGALSFEIHADPLRHFWYWDLNSISFNAFVLSGHNINAAMPGGFITHSKHRHFLRVRYASKGTGSNTHIIYYEYSSNGINWFVMYAELLTSVNIDSMTPSVEAKSFNGTTPLVCKINKIIIGNMN